MGVGTARPWAEEAKGGEEEGGEEGRCEEGGGEEGEERVEKGARGTTGGDCVTGWRSDRPAETEAGTPLRLGNKGGRLGSPGRAPTSLLRAGEGAVDRQG